MPTWAWVILRAFPFQPQEIGHVRSWHVAIRMHTNIAISDYHGALFALRSNKSASLSTTATTQECDLNNPRHAVDDFDWGRTRTRPCAVPIRGTGAGEIRSNHRLPCRREGPGSPVRSSNHVVQFGGA